MLKLQQSPKIYSENIFKPKNWETVYKAFTSCLSCFSALSVCLFVHLFSNLWRKILNRPKLGELGKLSRSLQGVQNKNFQNYCNFSQICNAKSVNIVLWILHFVIIFLQKKSCKAWQRIIQPKSKSMAKFKRHWNMHMFENVQRRKCFTGYRNKLQNQSTS